MTAAPSGSVAAVQKALAEHRVAGAYFASGDHEGVTCRCSLPFNSYDEWASHRAVAAADAAVEAATPGIQAGALRKFGAKVLTEYEERTDRVGSYGQTKIRAALLTAGRMAEHEADRIEPRP